MKIDTGKPQNVLSVTGPIEGVIDYKVRPEHAERRHRQIIAMINACETVDEVDATIIENDLIIDNFVINFPYLWEAINEAAQGHKANLRHSAVIAGAPAPIPANSANVKQGEKRMFTIDTGDAGGGSQGPWMHWTSNGSAAKQLAPKTWVLRGKDENNEKFEHAVPAFENGCVLDLDSLQLGWMKDGAQGQAPEKRWNPSVSQATQRPDESKNANGKFAWTNALSIRCAIGGGQAATWEQASFGSYDAFSRLAKQIGEQWAEHSQNGVLLPLVKQTGVETVSMKSGSSNKPILDLVKWVPRPDCLKDDAPVIATAPAPAPAPAPTPVVEPAAAGVPEDIAF